MKDRRTSAAAAMLALCLLAGCSNNNTALKPRHRAPRIALDPASLPMSGTVCWYVEDDGSGHHGYACVENSLSFARPDGGGLFSCIQDLRAELVRANLNRKSMRPSYGGRTPIGWKIRNLSEAEILFLQAP